MLNLKTFDQLFTSPEYCSALEHVRQQRAEELAATTIDPVILRSMQDWSYLCGKIVGAEDEPESVFG
jgi:hypothetical protein